MHADHWEIQRQIRMRRHWRAQAERGVYYLADSDRLYQGRLPAAWPFAQESRELMRAMSEMTQQWAQLMRDTGDPTEEDQDQAWEGCMTEADLRCDEIRNRYSVKRERGIV